MPDRRLANGNEKTSLVTSAALHIQLSRTISALRMEAKPTHMAYGTNSTAAVRSRDHCRAMNHRMVAKSNKMTASATFGECAAKKMGDQLKLRAICPHHSDMAVELLSRS